MNKNVPFRVLLLIFFFFCSFLGAEETLFLNLKGHLGKEELAKARKDIRNGYERLIIEINSNSGDLIETLELAKEIYEIKAEKQIKVIVYIDDNAIGPAAIVPFLADELYISFFVSWGDILLDSDRALPTNILRNRVTSLVPQDHPKTNLLKLMGAAMSDPSLQIIDDDGWRIGIPNSKYIVISVLNETLVVNHNQIKRLGLVSGVMTETVFRKQFAVEPKPIEEEPAVTTAEVKPRKGVDYELQQYIRFDPEKENKVGIIRINQKKSQISQSTWIYVKNALDYYIRKKPIFIILELNTPGGEVFAAQKISDALKELDTQHNIPVVAFINNWAISAGAMLTYSCRFISVVKDASLGAAEPVLLGEGGKMVTAPEKINSALRADFANRASFFDRDPNIAIAMVDKDVIIVKRHGKILKLDREDQIRTRGPSPDILISPKEKLLTLNAEEMIRYGVADILLPPQKLEPITSKEEKKGEWAASKLLLFHYPYFENIPHAIIDEYQMDWRTQFFVILANPFVSSLVFLGMIIGFYVEINSPGFGVPGSIALACLFLIILSSFALDVANMLEVILLLVGVIFIALDLFLIPTFGLLGFIGVVFFIVGLFGMMLPGIGAIDYEFDTQTFNAAGEAFIKRLGWLSGTLVAAAVSIAVLGRFIKPTFAGFQRFVLAGGEETGYIAGESVERLPKVGSRGEVLATLRPAGKVLINDEIFDAVTVGEFIEQGTEIEVAQLDGSVIIVHKLEKKSS